MEEFEKKILKDMELEGKILVGIFIVLVVILAGSILGMYL